MSPSAAGPSLPTPPEVVAKLIQAFGEKKIGETGYDLAATRCCSEAEKADAKKRGSSLLYGEMLPDGVSKALHISRLGQALCDSGAVVLELGMGSGTVAMQIFLQCKAVRQVLGVELVRSRYEIAEVAVQRLAGTEKATYRICQSSAGSQVVLEEAATGRRLDCRCADFFSLGLDLTQTSDVIFFAVNIPCKLFPELCKRLAKAKDGCCLFAYHRLDTIWWSDEPCPFHQVEANIPESDTFSTSWSPQGFRFYVYVCDRKRQPQIKADARNETFSQWQAMWDEASQSYFYHNQESEASQWELPREVGCWRVHWSEEHGAWFFQHTPSGHTQWEAPKCMSDLGWSWAYGTPAAMET